MVFATGYYMVRTDGRRFFISENIDVDALDVCAESYLSKSTGYDYWVDFCYGMDGNDAVWENVDQLEKFI